MSSYNKARLVLLCCHGEMAYLALTVLKHLQSLFHLCLIISQLAQTVTGNQVL